MPLKQQLFLFEPPYREHPPRQPLIVSRIVLISDAEQLLLRTCWRWFAALLFTAAPGPYICSPRQKWHLLQLYTLLMRIELIPSVGRAGQCDAGTCPG